MSYTFCPSPSLLNRWVKAHPQRPYRVARTHQCTSCTFPRRMEQTVQGICTTTAPYAECDVKIAPAKSGDVSKQFVHTIFMRCIIDSLEQIPTTLS